MKRLSYCVIAALMIMPFVFFIACSNNDSSTIPVMEDTSWTSVQFADFKSLVENIAPPCFSDVSSSPANLEDWITGDYPILEKVFSEKEPMSVYSNLNRLSFIIQEMELYLLVNEGGEVIIDTSLNEGMINIGDCVKIIPLTNPTVIPRLMSSILGSTVDLNYMISLHFPFMDENQIFQVGLILNDNEQTILTYECMPEAGMIVSSVAFYAHFDANDSSVIVKGVFYKDYGNDISDRWVYDIHSVDESNFSYSPFTIFTTR